jgi:adenine-specific DNA methylase
MLLKECDDGLARAIQCILACAVDREAEHSSSLCRWNATGQKMQATFGHQTLRMLWDYCETNIFGGSVGSWDNVMECILSPFEAALAIEWEGEVECASATTNLLPRDAAHAFVTDPPYYDAVPYADLSDFFYVWLKRTVGDLFPDLFADGLTPKEEECVVDEIKGHDKAYFERMMGLAMAEGCRVINPKGVCVVVFAHKSTSSWEAQLQAMIDAGWIITGSWPIDTEMGTRLRAMNSAALASSIHLVCRPRKNPDGSLRTNDIGDWRDVLHELPVRIHEWMPRLATEGVVGADAIFACLGPALEIFSRCSRVERADGEQVTLKEYLEYVWAAVSREALDMIFQGADTSGFEPDARLTAMWLWTLSTSSAVNSNGQNNGKAVLLVNEEGEEDEEEVPSPRQALGGYMLEFDAARKIAQGLGAHLERLQSLVEIKGSTARLRSVTERGHFLFDKDAGEVQVTKPRKKVQAQQLAMFSVQELAEESDGGGDLPTFSTGRSMLDRLHQSMLLFAAGRGNALKRFLQEEGVGQDQRFWRLAQALSALYPQGSEERRTVGRRHPGL